MAHLSASFSAIGDAGASLDAIDLVRVEHGVKVRDVTVMASDAEHIERIAAAARAVPGVTVERVSDRVFLAHLGGKIEMSGRLPLKMRDDLSIAYTPGVARVCLAIAADRSAAWNLTSKRNTVAVVSDGSAVLGLGDIGPEAAMPVMEGKALLFKEFDGVDAWPLCLATQDTEEIIMICKAIRPASAASTSRTSRRHAASRSRSACAPSSTSRSSTTISTARRSSCWRR